MLIKSVVIFKNLFSVSVKLYEGHNLRSLPLQLNYSSGFKWAHLISAVYSRCGQTPLPFTVARRQAAILNLSQPVSQLDPKTQREEAEHHCANPMWDKDFPVPMRAPPCPAPGRNSLLSSCIVSCSFILNNPDAFISLQVGETLWQPLCLSVFCILHFLTEACARIKTLYYQCTTTATFSCSKIYRCYSCLRPQKEASIPVTGHGMDSCTLSPGNPLIFTNRRNERAAAYACPHQALLPKKHIFPKALQPRKINSKHVHSLWLNKK